MKAGESVFEVALVCRPSQDSEVRHVTLVHRGPRGGWGGTLIVKMLSSPKLGEKVRVRLEPVAVPA